MPELISVTAKVKQQAIHRLRERGAHDLRPVLARRPQQPPIKLPSEYRRKLDHLALRLAETCQPC